MKMPDIQGRRKCGRLAAKRPNPTNGIEKRLQSLLLTSEILMQAGHLVTKHGADNQNPVIP